MVGGQPSSQPWADNLYPSHAQPQVYRRERPTGVVVIAILNILGGAIMLFLAFAMIAVAFLASGEPEIGGVLGPVFGLIGLVLLLIALAYFVMAWGLLKLRPWARTITRVLAAIAIVLNLFSILAGDPFSIINLIFNIIILWYLGRPDIKAAFEPQRFGTYQAPRVY